MKKAYTEKPWQNVVLTVALVMAVVLYVSFRKEGTDEPAQDTVFAMDTAITVSLYGSGAQDQLERTRQCLDGLDGLLDWRTEGSLTERFNTESTADFSETGDMMAMVLDVAEKSGGAFDPTILPVSRLWDFTGEDPDIPSDAAIQEALEHVDYTRLTYENGRLSTSDPRQRIDLGAVGKGYAIMRAAKEIDSKTVTAGLISAGSSITAFGDRSGKEGFRIGLRDPRGGQDDLIGVLTLTDLSVSTSGDYERFFMKDGVRYHHILDARTGYPADSGLMSVSVIHENGALCDALSTAGFILGLEDGMALMDIYDAMAIFIDTERNVYYNDEAVRGFLDFQGTEKGYTLTPYR